MPARSPPPPPSPTPMSLPPPPGRVTVSSSCSLGVICAELEPLASVAPLPSRAEMATSTRRARPCRSEARTLMGGMVAPDKATVMGPTERAGVVYSVTVTAKWSMPATVPSEVDGDGERALAVGAAGEREREDDQEAAARCATSADGKCTGMAPGGALASRGVVAATAPATAAPATTTPTAVHSHHLSIGVVCFSAGGGAGAATRGCGCGATVGGVTTAGGGAGAVGGGSGGGVAATGGALACSLSRRASMPRRREVCGIPAPDTACTPRSPRSCGRAWDPGRARSCRG